MAFHPTMHQVGDGRGAIVLLTSSGASLDRWVKSGWTLKTFRGHADPVMALAVIPSGKPSSTKRLL
jgi:hypothetical protein